MTDKDKATTAPPDIVLRPGWLDADIARAALPEPPTSNGPLRRVLEKVPHA